MIKNLLEEYPKKVFITIVTLFIGLMFFAELKNGRFWLNDFKVMYSAAEALMHKKVVYGVPFGLDTGLYKYSPFTLLLFVPYTFLSYGVASIIHFWIISLACITTIFVLKQLISKYIVNYTKHQFLFLLLVFVFIITHLIRELHLGNVNIILLFLLCLAIKFTLESKYITAGVLITLVLFTKPYFVVILLPILLHKKYKVIFSVMISSIVFLLISLVFSGYVKCVELYSDWVVAMLNHSNYLGSNQTIYSILNYWFNLDWNPNYLLNLIICCLITGIYFWKKTPMSKTLISETEANKSLLIHYFLLIVMLPNLLITDTEHFLLILPFLAIFLIFLLQKPSFISVLGTVLVFFMYAGNSTDLLGKYWSSKHDECGLLGIANMIIIILVLFLTRKKEIEA